MNTTEWLFRTLTFHEATPITGKDYIQIASSHVGNIYMNIYVSPAENVYIAHIGLMDIDIWTSTYPADLSYDILLERIANDLHHIHYSEGHSLVYCVKKIDLAAGP
jgi:hypothetical protein